jgi:single stranded DNA-binding protein
VADVNRVEIRGGLTRDAEFRYVGHANTPLAEFVVAVNGARYDPERREQVVTTIFVSVQAWSTLAETVMERWALSQGDEVYVVGELDQREVEKRDGTKDRKTRVTAVHIDVLRSRHTLPSPGPRPESHTAGPTSEPPF